MTSHRTDEESDMAQHTITLAEARRRGWTIERGAYSGTTDDRRDRWYVYRLDAYGAVDRRGPGYRTRGDALEALDYQLGPRYPGGSDSACDIANDAIRAEIERQLNEAESEISGENLWDRCMAAPGGWATDHEPATRDEIEDAVWRYYRPIIAAAIRELRGRCYSSDAIDLLGGMPEGVCTACEEHAEVRDILGRCYRCAGLD